MMPMRNLSQMVVGNTVRSPRHFVFSAIGVVIGIGAFVFFLAGVLRVQGVLYSVFPLEEVEVIAPHTSIAGKNLSQKLNQGTVDLIKKRPAHKARHASRSSSINSLVICSEVKAS